MQYSEKVQGLFLSPKNLGEIKDADGVGEVGNAKCGDIMKLWIKVNPKTKVLEDIKFKTFGCAAAIATSSIITEMAKGKTIDEALQISNEDVAKELGGLPPVKMHCSNLAADALRKAITNYRRSQEILENKNESFVKELITKEMTIAEVIENHPQVMEILLQFGFRCIGCKMSSIGTLEEGAEKHGIDVDEMIDALNAVIH